MDVDKDDDAIYAVTSILVRAASCRLKNRPCEALDLHGKTAVLPMSWSRYALSSRRGRTSGLQALVCTGDQTRLPFPRSRARGPIEAGFALAAVRVNGEFGAGGRSSQVVAETREERARENAAENDAPLTVGDLARRDRVWLLR